MKNPRCPSSCAAASVLLKSSSDQNDRRDSAAASAARDLKFGDSTAAEAKVTISVNRNNRRTEKLLRFHVVENDAGANVAFKEEPEEATRVLFLPPPRLAMGFRSDPSFLLWRVVVGCVNRAMLVIFICVCRVFFIVDYVFSVLIHL